LKNQNHWRNSMGLASQQLKVFLHEHKHKPLTGRMLSFGAQSIFIGANEVANLFSSFGLPFNTEKVSLDTSTYRRKEGGISDKSVFEQFSNLTYESSDYSNYENATRILDLNFPVPEELHHKYDIIYSGGVLDNIFNPAQALINLHNLLKPGGRAIIFEACVFHAGVYCGMSPEWFFSFFSVNDYDDVQSYVEVRRSTKSQHIYSADLFSFSPYFTRVDNYNYVDGINAIGGQMYNIVIAEKSIKSGQLKIPTQSHYLSNDSIDWRLKYDKYKNSQRSALPVEIIKTGSDAPQLPLLSDHFQYIGSG
jgi:SAM-dependent methyltransferase